MVKVDREWQSNLERICKNKNILEFDVGNNMVLLFLQTDFLVDKDSPFNSL